MNIFKNKYFLLGNLAFLLLVIPVVLYFVKNQTSTKGSAAPTTTLSFNPASLTPDQCDNTKTAKISLNPGSNIVSTVQLALKWDKSKFDIDFAPNTTAFSQTLKARSETQTGMTITLNIGADVTKAISTTTDVGTVTIKPLAPTNATVINLDIDAAGTKVYSLSSSDGVTENVYNSSASHSLQLSITSKSCNGASPSVTAAPATTATVSPTSTPTPSVVNQPPACLNLATSVSSGSAPLSVTLTASGNDSDGTIAKTTFNFGDGTQQDVTTGMGTASASAQLAHTYNSGGNFSATVSFTDNSGGVGSLCTQAIAVTGAVATIAPTATATPTPTPTELPTATPTIKNPGGVGTTFGIIGGIVAVIAAGIFLLAL